jgi:hypothetical protein
VVSKMTTRSFSDFAGVVMKKVLLALRPSAGAPGFLVTWQPPECPGASAQPALRGG